MEKRICSESDCGKPAKAKGMCNTHYERLRRGHGPRPVRQPCSVDGCETLAQARGLCKSHWWRWKQHGDPHVTIRNYGAKRSTMSNGYIRVWVPGHPAASRHGYALEHRYVMHELGYDIEGMHVHHIDHNRANNDPSNLLVMSAEEHSRYHGLVKP